MKLFLTVTLAFCSFFAFSQLTVFERSNGKETATYQETISFYEQLDKASAKVFMQEAGPTDSGYPLHVVMVSSDRKFDPVNWHKQNKAVILIMNGIHPGEPDGVDATMMLVRDIASGKLQLPSNVCLSIIPIYNIGGALNRNSTSRVNQNGPLEYGFRGNSQNLDLNRDFTKCDSREARSFTKLFHQIDPDIFIDNHVSDGADYQYTMTLLTTQYEKLGEPLGSWLRDVFEPAIYADMKQAKWEMVPYVNVFSGSPEKGIVQFLEQPRYSSGFAALFQTIAFTPETHMLKPFADRVRSALALEKVIIQQASLHATTLKLQIMQKRFSVQTQKSFPLSWVVDSSKYTVLDFKGYEQGTNTSGVTGIQKMFYDRTKPFTRPVKFYNFYTPSKIVNAPKYYVIPQGWHTVIDLLRLNEVRMQALKSDSTIEVEAYRIDQYKTFGPYEKHYPNHSVKVSSLLQKIKFRKGDILISLDQPVNRYIIEMLEPTGDDSFFAWNFFDAILQQKEGYSDYRWEDIAAEVLTNDPLLKKKLDERRSSDTAFAKNPSAQLNFVYKNSPYYEPVHMRYPVFRIN
jgi:hypothetical protein